MSKTLLIEIRNVSLITLLLGIIQIFITIPVGYFGIPSILGTLLGCFIAMINFSLMGVVLEKCLSTGRAASSIAGFGYIFRLCIIAAAVIWAMKVSYLNYVCVIVPLLFPQIAIFLINLKRRKESGGNERT